MKRHVDCLCFNKKAFQNSSCSHSKPKNKQTRTMHIAALGRNIIWENVSVSVTCTCLTVRTLKSLGRGMQQWIETTPSASLKQLKDLVDQVQAMSSDTMLSLLITNMIREFSFDWLFISVSGFLPDGAAYWKASFKNDVLTEMFLKENCVCCGYFLWLI